MILGHFEMQEDILSVLVIFLRNTFLNFLSSPSTHPFSPYPHSPFLSLPSPSLSSPCPPPSFLYLPSFLIPLPALRRLSSPCPPSSLRSSAISPCLRPCGHEELPQRDARVQVWHERQAGGGQAGQALHLRGSEPGAAACQKVG